MPKISWTKVAALMLYSLTASAAAPVADLTAPRTTCAAPCAIFFDARGTTDADSGDHADDLLDLIYTWNFDDPASGTWQQGARAEVSGSPLSRNTDTGFISGHVYETPGTYQPTVTVTDGTSTSTDTLTITILDPDNVWSGSQTACIANGSMPVAGAGGCPAGAQTANMRDMAAALSTFGCDDSARRCLFRRGDSFDAASIRMRTMGPTLIGAYGSGPKPIVRSGPGQNVLAFEESRDMRIVDLEFIGSDTDTGIALMLNQTGNFVRQLLMLRLDTSHYDTHIQFHGRAQEYEPGVNVPRELAIVDSTMLDGPGLHAGKEVFMMWEDSLFMGNRAGDKFDSSGGAVSASHNVRAKFSHGVVYSHNSLGLLNNSGGRIGCGTTRHVVKLVSALASDYFPSGVSRENILADNYISSCKNNQWDTELGRTDSTSPFEGQKTYLVERNFFTKRFSDRTGISLQVDGEEGAVRNNVFDVGGDSDGVRVWNHAPSDTPLVPTRDVRVINNSCYRPAGTGTGSSSCVRITSDSTRAIVRNNINYDPDNRSSVVSDAGSGTITCSGCNIDATTTPYVSSNPRTITDFAPVEGGPATSGGSALLTVPINSAGVANGTYIGAWDSAGASTGSGPPSSPPAQLQAPVLLP